MAAEEIDNHWEIKNGKAHLVDTVGDDILIKNEGDKDYKTLSEYDFTENMSAAKDIVGYYSSENILSSVNGGNFELNPSYFKTEKRAKLAYGGKNGQTDHPIAEQTDHLIPVEIDHLKNDYFFHIVSP